MTLVKGKSLMAYLLLYLLTFEGMDSPGTKPSKRQRTASADWLASSTKPVLLG